MKRQNEDFKIVGKSIPLRDGVAKVTGKAKYTADHKLPGMLYAKVAGSPYPHAKVKSINTKRAESLPGVHAVITCKDVPKITFQPIESREILPLSEHIRCWGDEIAAVAAETPEIAEEAVGLIDIEYEVLPAVFDPQEALKPDAPKLYPEGNLSTPDGKPLKDEWGNVEEAFKNAKAVVKGTFTTPGISHAPIEPRACVASWEEGKIKAWVSTQFPHRVRVDIARVMSLPLTKVRVFNEFVGGAFGGKKQERYPIITSLLAQKAQRPVKLEYTREEELSIGRRRYGSRMDMQMACNEEGKITGFIFDGYYDVGACGNMVGGSLLFLLSQYFFYHFESARFTAWDVNTNTITAQPMRGVQVPGFQFALEQMIDEMAEKMDMDPIEFRRINTYRSNAVTVPYGEELSTYPIEECLNKGKEVFGWDQKWKGWKLNNNNVKGKKVRGVGMASSMGWCNWEPQLTSVSVEVQTDGSATLYTGTTDLGTGSRTTLSQILAEGLGLPLDKVGLVQADTDATAFDHGCCASRTLYVAGLAVTEAIKEIKEQLFAKAAQELGEDPDGLYLEDEKVKSQRSQKEVPIADLIKHSIFGRGYVPGMEEVAPGRFKKYVGGAAAHFAEVEVDTETGEVKVVNFVAVHDVGRAINPAIVENQIFGAVFQGIGYGLTEELRFDPEANRYLQDSFTDFKILTIKDMPNIKAIIVEPHEPLGPYGAKGVGEHALNCTAGAIGNAIRNAIGVRCYDSPMTPEKILQAIKEQREG